MHDGVKSPFILMRIILGIYVTLSRYEIFLAHGLILSLKVAVSNALSLTFVGEVP